MNTKEKFFAVKLSDTDKIKVLQIAKKEETIKIDQAGEKLRKVRCGQAPECKGTFYGDSNAIEI